MVNNGSCHDCRAHSGVEQRLKNLEDFMNEIKTLGRGVFLAIVANLLGVVAILLFK